MLVDAQGWLQRDQDTDPRVELLSTRSTYPLIVPHPIGVVWHTTDTPPSRTAESLARNIVDNTKLQVSWHALVDRDGTIWQSAPFTVGTWHTGTAGVVEGQHFGNVNRATIGVELVNAGRLKRIAGKFYMWPYYKRGDDGRPDADLGVDARLVIADAHVRPAGSSFWEVITDPQVAASEAMVRALATWRPAELGKASAYRYGHVNFPSRSGKEDPGLLWPPLREKMLSRVFGGGGGLGTIAAFFLGAWGLYRVLR